MNDTILSKNKSDLNLPCLFTHRIGRCKSAAISNLIYSSTKWSRSYIVLALIGPSNWMFSIAAKKWRWEYFTSQEILISDLHVHEASTVFWGWYGCYWEMKAVLHEKGGAFITVAVPLWAAIGTPSCLIKEVRTSTNLPIWPQTLATYIRFQALDIRKEPKIYKQNWRFEKRFFALCVV